jgi:hypothetical protein
MSCVDQNVKTTKTCHNLPDLETYPDISLVIKMKNKKSQSKTRKVLLVFIVTFTRWQAILGEKGQNRYNEPTSEGLHFV